MLAKLQPSITKPWSTLLQLVVVSTVPGQNVLNGLIQRKRGQSMETWNALDADIVYVRFAADQYTLQVRTARKISALMQLYSKPRELGGNGATIAGQWWN